MKMKKNKIIYFFIYLNYNHIFRFLFNFAILYWFYEGSAKFSFFLILYHQFFTRLLPLIGMLLIKCSMLVNLNNILLLCIIILLLLLILSSNYFTYKIYTLYKNLLIIDELLDDFAHYIYKKLYEIY